MWIDSNKDMPDDMVVVIALYLGVWPGRGNSGITDLYAKNKEWVNVPEGITIVGWFPVPSTDHLPIKERSEETGSDCSPELLGAIETQDPEIFECIFEGDTSLIGETQHSGTDPG